MDRSQRNDAIATRIQEDLEHIRNCVSLYALPISVNTTSNWSCNDVTRDQAMPNGQLIYTPDLNSCFNGSLASDLIAQSILPVNGILDTNHVLSRENIEIHRQITEDDYNNNLLKVTYTPIESSNPKPVQSFTMSIPAQAWCP